MVELVNAADLKSAGSNALWVPYQKFQVIAAMQVLFLCLKVLCHAGSSLSAQGLRGERCVFLRKRLRALYL